MNIIEAYNKIMIRFWIDFFAEQIKLRGLLFEQEIWENPKEKSEKIFMNIIEAQNKILNWFFDRFLCVANQIKGIALRARNLRKS